ncbi:MAG: DUF3185 family protein [Flavobacteriales bacterium]|jgi:drug/metabolite transporter (DMT)-like permease|nr:DUF3185 family protein [Flavobacteriales bacterium]
MKKSLGVVLLVAGIVLAAVGFYQQSQDNKILEIGNLEIEKDATENINMLIIAGVICAVGGMVVIAVGKK